MKKIQSFFMKNNRPTERFFRYGFFIFSFSRPQDSCPDGEGSFTNTETETFCVNAETLKTHNFFDSWDEEGEFFKFQKNPHPDYIRQQNAMFTEHKFETMVCNRAWYQYLDKNYCLDYNIPSPGNTCIPSETDPLATTKNAQCPPGYSPSFSTLTERGSWIAQEVPTGSMNPNQANQSNGLQINGKPIRWINVGIDSKLLDGNWPHDLSYFLDQNCNNDQNNTIPSILCPADKPYLYQNTSPVKIEGDDFVSSLDRSFLDTTSCSSTGVSQDGKSLTLHLPGACPINAPFCDKRCLQTKNQNVVACNCIGIVGDGVTARQNAESTQDYYTIGKDGKIGFSSSPKYIEITAGNTTTRFAQNPATSPEDIIKGFGDYLNQTGKYSSEIIKNLQEKFAENDINLLSNGCGLDGIGESLACDKTNCQIPFSNVLSVSPDGTTKSVQEFCFHWLIDSWFPGDLKKVNDTYASLIENSDYILPQNVYENKYFKDFDNDTAKDIYLASNDVFGKITQLHHNQYCLVDWPYNDMYYEWQRYVTIACLSYVVFILLFLSTVQFLLPDISVKENMPEEIVLISKTQKNEENFKLFRELTQFVQFDKKKQFCLEQAIVTANELEQFVAFLKKELEKIESEQGEKKNKKIKKLIEEIKQKIEKYESIFRNMDFFSEIKVKDMTEENIKFIFSPEINNSIQKQGQVEELKEEEEISSINQSKSDPVSKTNHLEQIEVAIELNSEYKKIKDAFSGDVGEIKDIQNVIMETISILQNNTIVTIEEKEEIQENKKVKEEIQESKEKNNEKVLKFLFKSMEENLKFSEKQKIMEVCRQKNYHISSVLCCLFKIMSALISIGFSTDFILFSLKIHNEVGNQPTGLSFPMSFLTIGLSVAGVLNSLVGFFDTYYLAVGHFFSGNAALVFLLSFLLETY